MAPVSQNAKPVESEPELKLGHINLFEGIKIVDPIKGLEDEKDVERDGFKKKKMWKEEAELKIIIPEDEKYRIGYGGDGKGVKLPWYLQKPSDDVKAENGGDDGLSRGMKEGGNKNGKKTLEELREERLRREKREKEREWVLLLEKRERDRANLKPKGLSKNH